MDSFKLKLPATVGLVGVAFALLLAGARAEAVAVDNGLARTPPMGWNS